MVQVLHDDLHWQPIKQPVKVVVLSFKMINEVSPPYLAEMFIPDAANPALDQTNQRIEENMSYSISQFHYSWFIFL